ncbi:Guanosine-3',5'-bis(Diphosphate) 3'-pyrophosphohydrolase [Roseibacterium elongatum DSM 19469]|uniref:Guanosine-3',5'-bis(Diphosphate) 3'-pyrophosphohydrolase n=1 Tax=Roseicyclus elongatus DSM 19469 TaxID=1294273 RepID=W8RVB7_9RHOB|nr:HD domain-containing protein [Roseibacterium elongatum]AHM05154.1 Guanosine-3',5'-bis(Diphosphate) 3'-pyrophosphohydrolase [Roseibacterium elongatum DSM 19469]
MMKSYLGEAFELAFQAHAGQVDKAGQPYVLHLVRVATALSDRDERVVALLHDVLEDTEVSAEDLALRFPPDICAAVEAITKRPHEAYEGYLARVAANPISLAVKLADMADNADPARLAALDPDDRARLREKYATARTLLIQLAEAPHAAS